MSPPARKFCCRCSNSACRQELDNAERGPSDLDVDALGKAAAGRAHSPIYLGTAAQTYPSVLAGAVEVLRRNGIGELNHLRRVLGGGDVVHSTGVGGSGGYSHHDAEQVHLYLEGLCIRVTGPDAVVALTE